MEHEPTNPDVHSLRHSAQRVPFTLRVGAQWHDVDDLDERESLFWVSRADLTGATLLTRAGSDITMSDLDLP